jgi:glycosyltransferase involved in cell wall biosynthesis
MRHLQFTQSLEPLYGGGLGSSARALHREFRALNVDSTLCSTYGEEQQFRGNHTYEFRRIKPGFLYFAPELKSRAKEFVSATDVLHGHGLYVGTNYLLGCEARRQRKSMVYHIHGMFDPYILGRSQWKKRLVHWLFEDANFRHVQLWRALTSKEADQIRRCGITKPIVVAPNGLNTAEYTQPAARATAIRTPLVPELQKSCPRILFLSRLHPKKGLDLLLPAWARIVPRYKDWELVIAGPDEQGYMAVLQRLAEKLGLQDRIIFTGSVTGEAKVQLLYSADVFALPSYSEGLPVSLLEAMACEVPVVASKECNCLDIGPAEAGWLCDPTVSSVTDSMTLALGAMESERKQRGANGKRLVENVYSWPKITSEILRACEAHCS